MFPKSFKKLIDHFASLPSVGPKMAERLVLYLFKKDQEILNDFGESLLELKTDLRYCQRCFNLSEGELCSICQDQSRDKTRIAVVEEPLDVIAIEKTRSFKGLYHILGGTIDGENSDKLKIKDLEERVKTENVEEIILAMNPTTEGDATALYVKRILKPLEVKITSLGRGLSTGGDIEYADEMTLSSAINNRKEI